VSKFDTQTPPESEEPFIFLGDGPSIFMPFSLGELFAMNCTCIEMDEKPYEIICKCTNRKKCIQEAKDIIRESEDSKDN